MQWLLFTVAHLKVDRDLDDVDAHGHNMSAGCAVVPGTRVTLESVGEVARVQEMVSKIVVTSSDRLLDAV